MYLRHVPRGLRSDDEGKSVVAATGDRIGAIAAVDPDTGRGTIEFEEDGPIGRARAVLGQGADVPTEIGRDDLAQVTDKEVRLRD